MRTPKPADPRVYPAAETCAHRGACTRGKGHAGPHEAVTVGELSAKQGGGRAVVASEFW